VSPRALLLDRDGTLIDVVRDEETGTVVTAFHPSHVRFLPGVVEGLRRASKAGFVLGVATNQPGPAKGQCSVEAVRRTNDALIEALSKHGIGIAALECCMHHPAGGPSGDPSLVCVCDCRKPAPGMLLRLMERLGASPRDSIAVGDTEGDVLAARAAGARAALLLAARCDLCPRRDVGGARPDLAAPSFEELIEMILEAG
jgi:D-glycero-D-manno-heptose 1,7-bisphosphate phosphatase